MKPVVATFKDQKALTQLTKNWELRKGEHLVQCMEISQPGMVRLMTPLCPDAVLAAVGRPEVLATPEDKSIPMVRRQYVYVVRSLEAIEHRIKVTNEGKLVTYDRPFRLNPLTSGGDQ